MLAFSCYWVTLFLIILFFFRRINSFFYSLGVAIYIYGNYYLKQYSFDLHYAQIGDPLNYYIITIFTSLFWLIIVNEYKININGTHKSGQFNMLFIFSFIGKNTLIVLEGHQVLLLLLINPYFNKIRLFNANIHEMINCIVMFAILVPIIMVLNKRATWLYKLK